MKKVRRTILMLTALLPITLFLDSASWAQTKLDASIFSFDGNDFVRTNTTLMDKGQPATNTRLDHDTAAFKALIEKHCYTGPATIFGKNYDASYAPIVSKDGKLTGALFVGIPK